MNGYNNKTEAAFFCEKFAPLIYRSEDEGSHGKNFYDLTYRLHHAKHFKECGNQIFLLVSKVPRAVLNWTKRSGTLYECFGAAKGVGTLNITCDTVSIANLYHYMFCYRSDYGLIDLSPVVGWALLGIGIYIYILYFAGHRKNNRP